MPFPAPQYQVQRTTPTGMVVEIDCWDLPPHPTADRRPDLVDDSMTWDVVLAGAQGNVKLLDVLMGLRCLGATLFWSDKGRLRLEWRHAARSGLGEGWVLDRFLKPVTDAMAELFRRVEVGE